jgi:hypothetical protein
MESFDSIWVGPSTDLIPCVLAKSPRSYYIIFEATAVNKKQFELNPLRELLVVTSFLDSIVAGYYGKRFLFQGHPVLQFHAADIIISTPRQYCHKPLGLEIWFAKGYSLFLMFESSDARNVYEVLLASQCVLPFSKSIFSLCFGSELTKLVKNRANLLAFRDQWVSNKLSSFAYLLILNFFSDRSFANYSQYPVMPWVHPSRSLSKPMGQQTPERGATFIDRFDQSGPDWHFYGSLYSCPAIVYHFLVRVQPFTNCHLDLQHGFDHPDRLFSSIEEGWRVASETSSHSVPELLPEMFVLPELFMNINHWDIPKRSRGVDIANSILPAATPNWPTFVWRHRRMLDDAAELEGWLDLIFGPNSRGQGAIDAFNLFYPVTYGLPCSAVATDDPTYLQMQRNYGQVPTQLFFEPHPKRDTITHSRSSQLTTTASVTSQRIKIYTIESPLQVLKEPSIKLSGALFNWPDVLVEDFACAAVSSDRFLFVGAFNGGGMVVCHAMCKADRTVQGFVPLVQLTVPSMFVAGNPKMRCCAVSSHLFLACASVGSIVLCVHVSSGRFIRALEFAGPVEELLINDTYQIIFGVGKQFVEVFTINGTRVAFVEVTTTITSAALSVNDVSVFLTTAHVGGIVKLWEVDPEQQVLVCRRELDARGEVTRVEVVREGSALVAVGAEGPAIVFCARGMGTPLFKAALACGCANCEATAQLACCSSCGLYFCGRCCQKAKKNKAICNQCLKHIEEYSAVIDE